MEPVGFYRGDPIYEYNPSRGQPLGTVQRRRQVGDPEQGMWVSPASGEVLKPGARVFYAFREIDPDSFIKLYAGGVQNMVGLTKAGLLLFTMVHREMVAAGKSAPKDQIALSQIDAAQNGLSRGQFYRGLRELLDAGFLYRTKWPSIFFVNVLYIFRGDRVAFFNGYRKSGELSANARPIAAD